MRGTTGARTVVPPSVQGSKAKPGQNLVQASQTQKRNAGIRQPSLITGLVSGVSRYFETGSVAEGATEGTLAGLFTAGSLLVTQNPYARFALVLAGIYSAQKITDQVFEPQQFNNIAGQVQDRQLQLRNKNNVVVVEDETDETNIGGSLPVGDASSLLVVSSSNLDNPYLTNSYIQYNIML